MRARWSGALKVAGSMIGLLLGVAAMPGVAQKCTTQARMEGVVRTGLADEALTLASAMKSGDVAAVRRETAAEYASAFDRIEGLIDSANAKLAGETLKVTQVYVLDASMVKGGGGSELDFTCPLKDAAAETDFAIQALPPKVYGFAMVEAAGGEHPWVLSFLLEQEGSGWKMVAFYFHPRTAAGRDGVWYWTAAREHVRAKQPWLAWMEYGEAVELLRPAAFVSSTQLDKLLAEQRTAAPKEVAEGISAQTPVVVKGADGMEFRFTSMTNETTPDGRSLELILHYAAGPVEGVEANRARNMAAVKAMMDAHAELRPAYSAVIVFGDSAGQNPSVLSLKMAEVP